MWKGTETDWQQAGNSTKKAANCAENYSCENAPVGRVLHTAEMTLWMCTPCLCGTHGPETKQKWSMPRNADNYKNYHIYYLNIQVISACQHQRILPTEKLEDICEQYNLHWTTHEPSRPHGLHHFHYRKRREQQCAFLRCKVHQKLRRQCDVHCVQEDDTCWPIPGLCISPPHTSEVIEH